MPLVTIGSHVFFGATENFKNPAKSEKTLGAGTSGMQCWKATPASQCRASRCLRATKNQARWVPFFQSVVFLQKSAWNMLKPQTTGAIFGGQPCHQGWQIRSSLIQELFTVVFSRGKLCRERVFQWMATAKANRMVVECFLNNEVVISKQIRPH